MAPIVGPGKKQLLEMLARRDVGRRLPIRLADGSPLGFVDCRDGVWRLVRTGLTPEGEKRMQAEAKRRLAAGESWMPEHTWAFHDHEEVVLQASDKSAFMARIEDLEWTFGGRSVE